MKCTNCDYEQDEPFRHCPECGAPVETTEEMMEGPAAPLPNEFANNAPMNGAQPYVQQPVNNGQMYGQQPVNNGQVYGQTYVGPQQGPVVTNTAKIMGTQPESTGQINYGPGSPLPPQPGIPPVAPYPGTDMSGWNVYQRLNALFSDNLFLAVCILYTVYAAMSIIGIITFSLSVTGILFCIFFWIAYSQAKKNTLTWNAGARISGTVFACFIIRLVVAGLFVILGIFAMVVFSSFGSGGLYRYFMYNLPYSGSYYYEAMAPMLQLSGTLILIMCIIAAVCIVLFAVFGIKGIHKFTRSVYKSVQTGVVAIEKRSRAAAWLMTFGIFAGISALIGAVTIIGFLINAPHAVALIMLSILVNKYFKDFD